MKVFRDGRKRNKKGPNEELDDYRTCMDLLCSCKTQDEAVEKANSLGIVTVWGTPLSWQTFLRYCHYILLYEPDKWREKVSQAEGPMTDEEWDLHIMETAISFAVYNKSVVYRLILSDTGRWGRYEALWKDNPVFARLRLPA